MHKALDKYSSANLILKENQNEGVLLIGDCTSAVDKQILKPYKIQTIITIGTDSAPQKKEEGINYIFHNVLDNKNQKISNMFDQVYEQIDEARKSGGVLVHCYTGVSRSSSFVIAYMMRKKFMSYDDAKAFVKKQRNVIHPNDNFHRQLQAYWKYLTQRYEEQKIKNKKTESLKVEQFDSTINNESEINFSQISSFTKRTARGVKGAVKAAFRSGSPRHKSIQQTAQKSVEKNNEN